MYASRSGEAGALVVSSCARTRPVEDAAADLAYARSVSDGTAPSGRITGQVLLGRRDLSGKTLSVAEPIPGVIVRISREGFTDTIATNEAGDFEVEGRGAGAYNVSVDVPDGYYADVPSTVVDLRDARGCADASVTLYSNGVLSGRVIDASGRPVPGLTVEIAQTTLRERKRVITDRDGRYVLTRLPSGRFLVGINTVPSHGNGTRQPRVFHPGVEAIVSASRVAIAEGQRVMLDDLRIPSHIAYVPVSGFVRDADGTPAEGARVYLRGAAEGDRILTEPAIVDFLGRFVIAGLAGANYEIFAERSRAVGGTDSTDPVRLTAGDKMSPVRLVIRRRY